MRHPLSAVLTVIVCAVALAGCVPLPFLPQPQAPQQTPHSGGGPAAQAPDGWADFEPCDPSDRWIWVDGFPADAMEAAGLEPECGGTYFDPDLPTYTSVADSTVTPEQLDELQAQVEALGFEQTASTFEPPQSGDEPGLVGSFQYERNIGDPDAYEAIYLVNFWSGSDPIEYQTFLDFESAATRDLQR